MTYHNNKAHKHISKTVLIISAILLVLIAAASGAAGYRIWVQQQMKPISSESRLEVIDIPEGATVQEIAKSLQEKKIIRNAQAFTTYVRNNGLMDQLKAGTYQLDASNSTQDIAATIAEGKVQEDLITILPGKRLDQIRQVFEKRGFTANEIDIALDPSTYKNHPALVSKPTAQSLEGYVYPESFKTSNLTTPTTVVEQSLDEMAKVITPEIIDAWRKQGFTSHEAITLASIIEQEVSSPSDRKKVAGVFYNRLKKNMMLQSDPTYKYAAIQLGVAPNSNIESLYNTYRNYGLPPGPISNVTKTSLEAVAYPDVHDHLYFVAGDDGITRFSNTLEEHEALTKKYCIELCKTY